MARTTDYIFAVDVYVQVIQVICEGTPTSDNVPALAAACSVRVKSQVHDTFK